eukprot:TRINITY_DN1601_c0_g1_i1.p1 TRINITY_DN1601_c0_g1~~TRINITY_DN1601_c0_g1_i1.p1  ORF type:complete len:365 (-),score=20.49 TRINITY_DN1601_c0_g1_i1:296-1390(-)
MATSHVAAESAPHTRQVHRLNPTGHALAAGIASATTTLVPYPLDLIKTRFQVHDGMRTNLPRYNNIFHAFRHIYRSEGIIGTFFAFKSCPFEFFCVSVGRIIKICMPVTGFYAGVTPAIVGSAVAWAAYMFTYAEIKDYLQARGEKLKTRHIMVAGISAGAVTALVTNPIWVIKTRMQIQLAYPDSIVKYTGMLDAIRRMYAEEGLKSFYKGIIPALIASYHSAVQFLIYENATGLIQNSVNTTHPGSIIAFFSGGLSKVGAMLATQPWSVLKARLQEQRDGHKTYVGFIDCIKKIASNEGLAGFYKGFTVSIYRLVLSSSLFFVMLEQNKQFFLDFKSLRDEIQVDNESNKLLPSTSSSEKSQ